MAKGKGSNPADAARKAARARELKRNKAERAKSREAATVKKDLRPLEADIRALQSKARGGGLSKAEQADLADLQAEVARIRKAKDEYVEAHPEHRKYVYPHEHAKEEAKAKEAAEAARAHKMATAQQSGAPIVPAVMKGKVASRSVYFDAVFNPTGAPPPGMPYMEKPMEEWDDPEALSWRRAMGMDAGDEEGEEDEEDEEDGEEHDDDGDDDDDDIVMPEGPPPPEAAAAGAASASDDEEDEDGIVMPSGPPPSTAPPQPPTGPAGWSGPPLPPGPPPPHAFQVAGPSTGFVPRPPPGFVPRPPPGFGRPPHANSPPMMGGVYQRPPRPPRGFYGRPPVMQHTDPLAADGEATLTYQGWRARPRPGGAASGPPATSSQDASTPPSPPPPRPPPSVISAKPQLRDLRKEATAFVPAALRKKQAAAKAQATLSGLPGAVDAAPSTTAEGAATSSGAVDATGGEEGGAAAPKKVGLMEALGKHMAGGGASSRKEGNDYDAFLDEVGDLL